MNNGTANVKSSNFDELRTAVGKLQSGGELIRLLEAQAKTNPATTERLASLVVAVVTEAGRKSIADQKGRHVQQVSLADARMALKGVSFAFPRGRHDIGFLADGLGICGSKHDVKIPYPAVDHVAILEDIPSEKKKVLVMLTLSRSVEIAYGKQKLSSVLLQFSRDDQLDVVNPNDPKARLQGPSVVVLCQALGMMGVPPSAFCNPSSEVFQSSQKGLAISAFVKVQQGWLFPLDSALCFVEKPPLLIPHSEIKSVELGRAGGMSATFDLIIHLRSGEKAEFGQIGSEELSNVSRYIADKKLKVGDGEDASSMMEEEGDDDSDDLEDEDFDPDSASDFSEEPRPSKRKRGDPQGAGPSTAGGSSAEGWEPDEEGYYSDEESEEVELVSDDEIPAEKILALVEQDKIASRSRTTASLLPQERRGSAFTAPPGAASGSGAGASAPGNAGASGSGSAPAGSNGGGEPKASGS